MQKRGMGEAEARQRIQTQPPQEEKVGAANVVIRNAGSFEEVWRQISQAWEKTVPQDLAEPATYPRKIVGELEVQRARPRQADEIAALISHLSGGRRKMNREDIMAAFGEKAFLLIVANNSPIGIAGWKVENLVARTEDVYLNPELAPVTALKVLMEEVEQASRELQCEISLLFLPVKLARQDALVRNLGYEVRTVQSLVVDAWQEAARESIPLGTVMLFKQLRQDRVLRPV
jgi:dephospho-CoA kinase